MSAIVTRFDKLIVWIAAFSAMVRLGNAFVDSATEDVDVEAPEFVEVDVVTIFVGAVGVVGAVETVLVELASAVFVTTDAGTAKDASLENALSSPVES